MSNRRSSLDNSAVDADPRRVSDSGSQSGSRTRGRRSRIAAYLGPSITACEEVGGRRGQGRQPRGSAGEATRSALTGLPANLTIELDGPADSQHHYRHSKRAVGSHTDKPKRRENVASEVASQRRGDRCAPPIALRRRYGAQTAWRERPALVAGEPAFVPKVLVAHATVLPLTAAPTASNRAGGKERRPTRSVSKSCAD